MDWLLLAFWACVKIAQIAITGRHLRLEYSLLGLLFTIVQRYHEKPVTFNTKAATIRTS